MFSFSAQHNAFAPLFPRQFPDDEQQQNKTITLSGLIDILCFLYKPLKHNELNDWFLFRTSLNAYTPWSPTVFPLKYIWWFLFKYMYFKIITIPLKSITWRVVFVLSISATAFAPWSLILFSFYFLFVISSQESKMNHIHKLHKHNSMTVWLALSASHNITAPSSPIEFPIVLTVLTDSYNITIVLPILSTFLPLISSFTSALFFIKPSQSFFAPSFPNLLPVISSYFGSVSM